MTFDSYRKKIVLLSDLHNNIEKFNKIIRHESADINICLGDWFDSFIWTTLMIIKRLLII